MRKLGKGNISIQSKLLMILAIATLFITVGFSSLSTILSIDGSVAFKPVSMILVTNIVPDQSTMQNSVSSSHTNDSINISCDLPALTDEVIYNVTIKNYGQTNKVLSGVIAELFSNDDMRFEYDNIAIGDVFLPGQEVIIPVTFKYKDNIQTINNDTLNAIIKFEFDDYELPPTAIGYFMPYNGDDGLFGFDKSTVTGFKRNTTLTYAQVLSQSGVQQIQNVSNDQYNSLADIYAWIDSNGVFNWWSNATTVYWHPNTMRAFRNVSNIIEVDLTGTDTSKVENFSHWFDTDRNLVRIIGKINTSGLKLEYNNNYNYLNIDDNTTSEKGLTYLFNDCNALTTVDLTEIDTTNSSDLKRMFGGCKSLTEIDLSRFNTANAKSMHWMFRNCNSLSELDLTSFDTTNVLNFYGMFVDTTGNSTHMTEITLGENFNTSNARDFRRMFQGLTKLTTINAKSDFVITNNAPSSDMFRNDTKLVGAAGTSYATAFSSSNITSSMAKIATPEQSGYFTLIGGNIKYTITYDYDGGTASNVNAYYDTTPTFTLNNPTKNGYTFIGWTGSNGNTPELSVTIYQGTIGNKHYEANWVVNTYNVQFSSNGGTGSMPIQEFTYGESKHLTINTFTRDGYIFNGWNTNVDGSGISYVDGLEVANLAPYGTVTLYAQWIEASDPFPTVFSINGSCTINGTGNITGDTCTGYTNSNIINTGVYLFNSENVDKDFEIGFTIDIFTRSEQTINQASFVNSKLENASLKYPGFVFRITTNTTKNELTATFGNNKQTAQASTSVRNVRIVRKDKKIYYSFDGSAFKQLIDQSSYTGTFNVPVTFGASIDSDGSPYRQLINTTLSNMYIKIGTMDTLE